ncbi:MAG: hypothetical protein JNL68_09635 [Burkholderiales bacterium]|nr:hypothetical protein [Burkholderiales bacterium]
MKHILVLAAVALSACSTVTPTKTAPPAQPAAPQAAAPAPAPAPAPEPAAPPIASLSDLEAMTFGCPKAGLNAAAREAAKAPAQGRYQFSYFKIISDAHHSLYEVHFESNDHEDPDLKYCVAIYCQQGWDPKTTKTSVSLMSDGPPTKAGAADAAHGARCGVAPQTPQKRKPRR